MSDQFYITTAIDYPNGTPHMGHAYEKIITDTYARWNRYQGKEVHFLTGTDENGQKLIESAAAEGKDTLDFVNEKSQVFRNLCKDLNISNDDFIRTTESRHSQTATEFWNKLSASQKIYAGKYSGNYCLACENFYTELQAPDGICPDHHTELELKEEDGYFFKLSEYSEWIIDYLKARADFVVPKFAHKEILSRLEREPLKDLAISRPSTGWGVKVPGDEKFVMYTWFDALINYYSALDDTQKSLWPADLHVIGKDILWFHAVIWPCMLKALEFPLPKQIYVHGMILAADGKKMSKSLNNGIDPNEILKRYPLDTFRYYLIRAISSNGDGAFSEKELIEKHNNELGNDFGNLIMRVIKLSLKVIPETIDGKGLSSDFNFDETYTKMKELMNKREHNKAMDILWEQVNKVNQYVNNNEPWKLKEDLPRFKHVIYNCLYSIQVISSLLSSFIPDTAKETLVPLGVELGNFESIKFGEVTYQLSVPTPLFPKIDLLK